jgi:hypothetical protein
VHDPTDVRGMKFSRELRGPVQKMEVELCALRIAVMGGPRSWDITARCHGGSGKDHHGLCRLQHW